MSWTRQDQERAFDLTREVVCGARQGTAFPIRVGAEAAWYLTCAHVLAEHGNDKPASVGGILALEVVSGAPVGLDLALLRLPGKALDPSQPAYLPIVPFATPAAACRIPGCYRPAEMKSFLRDWIDATIGGERTDIISPDGLVMKGWRLDVEGSLLEQGYSGAPVICADTGRVFAVAVMRTDGGKGGIAICISNLARILPPDLSGLLPTQQLSALTGLLRTILSDPAPGLDGAEIRALIRRSAPPGTPFDWPATEGMDAWCAWLLDRLPFSNARHPLYDLLDWLAGRLGDDAVRLEPVRQAQQNLLALYPDIDRAPLPEPGPQPAPTPALFEVVFEPLPAASFKDYAVHSHVHSPQPGPPASVPQAGPLREPDGGGRLDPHNHAQVIAYVKELTACGLALGLDPRTCIFQFRVPQELMLHPFDAWPRNLTRLPLGRDYPVVIGATERDWAGCEPYWASMQAGLTQPLGEMLTGCDPGQPASLDAAGVEALLGHLLEAPCLALQGVPDDGAGDAVTYLCVVAELGVAALWPRTPAAANGFCTALQERLGAVPLGQLPFALRDLRNQAAGKADTPAVWRDLTLFWDDPHRSAKSPRARFLPGLG